MCRGLMQHSITLSKGRPGGYAAAVVVPTHSCHAERRQADLHLSVLSWEHGLTGTDRAPLHCGGITKASLMLAAVKFLMASSQIAW